MIIMRTFGWIQNPNSLLTLKDVISAITPGSPYLYKLIHEKLPFLLKNGLISKADYNEFIAILSRKEIKVKYGLLKGKGGNRGINKNGLPNSKCSGIIQAVITAQKTVILKNESGEEEKMKKPYSDDWTADGYIRWAISTGLFNYDEKTDTVCVSENGKKLVFSEAGSDEEKQCFEQALLSYPPVIRVLNILNDDKPHTKFEIGEKLGFRGEMGFTSIPQNFFVAEICTASSKSTALQIRSNEEGDSDKYARTIARWLEQMGWVTTTKKTVCEEYCGKKYSLDLYAYQITIHGKKALKRACGYSKHARIPRIVHFEMLASKAPDAKYLRHRRALLLQFLGKKKWVSYEDLKALLHKNDIDVSVDTIKDDMMGLNRIGIDISFDTDSVMLNDVICKLIIPEERVEKLEVSKIKDEVCKKMKHLDHKFLSLIDLAFSDASTKAKKNADAREFEIETASLFVDELGFNGMRLGDADKPDVIISSGKNGLIIDNKSYKDGFNVDIHSADEMMRYVIQNNTRHSGAPVNEWWKNFGDEVTDFSFLFVTSFLKGRFADNIKSIHSMTGNNGGAIAVANLMYIAEDIKAGRKTKDDFFAMMNNDELVA